MVVVLEDLHWPAPTTLAVAEYLGDKLPKAGSAAAQDRHRMPRCRQPTGFTPTVRTSMRAGAADVARRKIAAMSATTSSGAATPKARARPTVPISHQELRAHVHCLARRHPICLMTAQRVPTLSTHAFSNEMPTFYRPMSRPSSRCTAVSARSSSTAAAASGHTSRFVTRLWRT